MLTLQAVQHSACQGSLGASRLVVHSCCAVLCQESSAGRERHTGQRDDPCPSALPVTARIQERDREVEDGKNKTKKGKEQVEMEKWKERMRQCYRCDASSHSTAAASWHGMLCRSDGAYRGCASTFCHTNHTFCVTTARSCWDGSWSWLGKIWWQRCVCTPSDCWYTKREELAKLSLWHYHKRLFTGREPLCEQHT